MDKLGYAFYGYAVEPLLTEEEVVKYRNALKHWDAELNFMTSDYRCKSNVLFKWAYDISMHPKVLLAVEEILGPDFDCWDMMLWIKPAGNKRGISAHQDAIYQNWFPKTETTSVFIGLTPLTTAETAPVRAYAGSHLNGLQTHSDRPAPSNMLMRGQTVDHISGQGVDVQIPAGSGFFVHPFCVHGGPPQNPPSNAQERIGVEVIYVSSKANPIFTVGQESALKVRGTNPAFVYDPAPTVDFGEEEQKVWRKAYDEQHKNYYKMTFNASATGHE